VTYVGILTALGCAAGCGPAEAPGPAESAVPQEFLKSRWLPQEIPDARLVRRDYRLRAGDTLAGGKSIGELHRDLNAAYRDIGLDELEVTVNLQTIAPVRVYVLGEVRIPGALC